MIFFGMTFLFTTPCTSFYRVPKTTASQNMSTASNKRITNQHRKKKISNYKFLRLHQVSQSNPPDKKTTLRPFFGRRWQETMPEAKMPLIAQTTACEHAQEKLAGDLGGCHWMFFCVSSLAKGDDEKQKKKII